MQPDPGAEGRRWLDQAIRDLGDARYARDGARHNLACFLCQQAAEKAVKGFLVLRGEERIWGHSVADLCELAGSYDEAFAEAKGDGAGLDVYYIPTRYPNGLPGGLPSDAFDEADTERALDRASGLIELVIQHFPQQ